MQVDIRFEGDIIYWRGPSPFHFVPVPEAECRQLADLAPVVSYGWGVIPVSASIGDTRWGTSLFPKDGGYLVPVKNAVRQSEDLDVGDVVSIELTIQVRT